MKLVLFTDPHGSMAAIKRVISKAKADDIEAVVCAGDLSLFERKLDKIVRELNKIKKPILIIPGNHETEKETKKVISKYDHLIYLHKKKYFIKDVLFMGFGTGGFSILEPDFEKMEPKFKKGMIKAKKTVLLIHGPPYKTKVDKIDRDHVGNMSFKHFIIKHQPDLVVCGHIHETFNKRDKVGKSVIINPGPNGLVVEI